MDHECITNTYLTKHRKKQTVNKKKGKKVKSVKRLGN